MERVINLFKVTQLLGIRAGTLNPSLVASRAHVLNPLLLCFQSDSPRTRNGIHQARVKPSTGWSFPDFRPPVLLFLPHPKVQPHRPQVVPQTPYFFLLPSFAHSALPTRSIVHAQTQCLRAQHLPWESPHSSSKDHSKVNASPKSP